MSPLALLLLSLASVPPAPAEVAPLPSEPPALEALGADTQRPADADAQPLAAGDGEDGGASSGSGDAMDEGAEGASSELEELRALEGAALDPAARPNAELLQALRRLGLANPLRQRMLDVLEEPTLREDDTPPPLPPITDLALFDVSQVQDRYDIPVEMQPLVAQYIEFFRGPGRKWFRKWVSRSTRYLPMMQPILESAGLPRDTVYLAMIESGFSPTAYSWAHASGPWQFISSTGRQYGLRQDFWVDERRDPVKATHAAARYLKDLYRELGHWYLAWAGYNTGGGRVRRLVERHGTSDFWLLSEEHGGLAKETRHYVPKLIAAALVSKHPEAFGFAPEEFVYEPALAYEEVKLPDATDLDVIARAAGVSVQQVQELNPELKRWCTPPASEKNPYVLRLPQGSSERFAQNFKRLPPHQRLTFKVHKVKRGDTLSHIALQYGSAVEAVMQMNRLSSTRKLRLGLELVVPVPTAKGSETVLASKVAQARRSGVVAPRPEDEVPAGTPRGPLPTGSIKTETVNGRTRITYGVAEGDSLWLIANRFNVTVDDLRQWNNLSRRKRTLKVGALLEVWPRPASKPASVPASAVVAQRPGGRAPATHTLAAGESLWSVAQRYGVTVEDIKRWNDIKDHLRLPTGKQLQVAAP